MVVMDCSSTPMQLAQTLKYANPSFFKSPSLTLGDLVFIDQLLSFNSEMQEKASAFPEYCLKTKKIFQLMKDFSDHPLASIGLKIYSFGRGNEVKQTLESIQEKLSVPFLPNEIVLSILQVTDQLALFEYLIKRPSDRTALMSWKASQNTYWSAIAKRMGVLIPKVSKYSVREYVCELVELCKSLSYSSKDPKIQKICKKRVTVQTFIKLRKYLLSREEDIIQTIFKNSDGQSLNIRSQALMVLPEIGNITSVRRLYLDDNHLEFLPDSIGKLTSLTHLSLSLNRLIKLPKSLGNCTHLTQLNLSGNRLKKLPRSFVNLKKLINLDCGFNQFQDFSFCRELTALKAISLTYNQLEVFPIELAKLNLEFLDLSANSLRTIPRTIQFFTALTYLDISNNGLEKLPVEINLLIKLKYFNADCNFLSEFPECADNESELIELSLENNMLRQLPDSIDNFTKLKKLNLRGNELRQLPYAITRLQYLNFLELSYNHLVRLPESFGNLTTLTHLDLEYNEIIYWPNSMIYLSLNFFGGKGNDLTNLPSYFLKQFQDKNRKFQD